MKRLFLVCLSLLLCMGCIAVLAAEEECTQHVAACTAPNVCVHCGHVEEGMGIGTGYCDYSIYHSYKDYHVLACSHCGMEKYEWTGALESEGHGRNCTENFCFTCGATDCNFIFVGHDPETFVTEDMGDTHGDKCGVCGGYEESSIMPHEAICTDPDVCRYCGHANPENVWHRNMSSTWTDLGTTHGKYCSDCQTYVDEEAHQASCAEPNKCIVCDLEVDTAELSHGSSAVVGDDTHHWVGCSLCKAPFDDKEAHFTYCSQDDQSICCGCGEAVDAANISFFHDFEDSSNWGYDDNVHWQNCWCGEVSNDYTETHERDCLMDACYCGYAGENITVNHFFDSAIGYEYDADSHWKTCTRCTDTEASKEGHKAACDAPNTCVYCRATNIDPKTLNHYGEVFWKNEGDTHTLVWSCCNITQVDSQPHVADCTADKTKCKVCEAEGVVTETVHSGELIWRNDGATHTQVRTCCSTAVGDSGEHRINCNAEDTSRCMTCGFVCEQIILNHNQQSKVWSDADTHWNGCFDCGKPFGDKISHYISCNSEDMSKCSGCGTTIDPANVNVAHNDLGLTEWEFDGEAHWRKECACGESMTWDTHWISCDALNAGCAVCGYAGSDMPVYHAFGGAVYIDGQYHEEACARCEHTQIEKHTSFSCQSNICELCGSSFDNTNPNHAWNYEAVQYDASGHWYSCIDCGEEMKSGHWYTCSDPDTCATCGYVSPAATKYDHYWTEVYQTDNPDYHYKKCDGCGDEYAIASHTVSCSNPGVCTGCGATNITVDEIKHGNVSWEYNATKHWGVCGTCGETQKEGPHWTDCSKPNLCQDCGATGVNIDPGILSHFNVDWNNREHDATHHWYTCRSCGSKAFYGQHYIKCSTEGVCFECGVTGDFTIEHEALKAGWLSDENNHWKICAVCDNVANKADHADTNNDEKCDTCNKELPHKHSWGEPVTKPATCTADGSITTTCGSCGESTVETIKSDGQDRKSVV